MILVSPEHIASYTQAGWWSEQTIGELFLQTAARQPEAPAVIDAPNRPQISGDAPLSWRWQDVLTQTGRLVALFAAQGLRKDDVVVMQLPNCAEMHAIYLACALTGVVVSPVPVQYRAHELDHILQITGAQVAIVGVRVGSHAMAQDWVAQRARWPQLRHIWALGADVPAGTLDLRAAWAASAALSPTELRAQAQAAGVCAHDVLTICWTSGTEAQPKGVPRNHNEWLIIGQSVQDAGQLEPGAHMVIPFPFVNMAGISTSLMAWLISGGCLHQHHPFDLGVFVQQLRDNPIEYSVAAPAVLNMMLKQPEMMAGVDTQRFARVGSGGGPLSPWLVEQMAERFGIEVVNYFGSNEGASLAASPQDVPDRAQRAMYFPRVGVPGYSWKHTNARKVETRLVDVDTGEVITESGRVGELRFRGPTIFSGYYKSPELTARAFDEAGFYRTGDLFEIAGERQEFYRFCGRHKDIVIRGGMNISAEELENLLMAHPAVRECAVVGQPDERLGEKVCAVVVLQPGQTLDLAVLSAFMAQEQVARYKWPEALWLLDTLPRNPVGKILKRDLRARLAQADTPPLS